MAYPTWIELLDMMQVYVDSKKAEDGWTLVQFWKTDATFYYTKPLTKVEKLMQKPENPAILVEAHMNDNGRVTERHVHRSSRQ